MYRVTLINDGRETIIHNPYTGGNKLLTGVIKLEINKVGQFEFQFLPNNDGYKSKIRPLLTLVQVVNEVTGKEVFYGRIGPIAKDMVESGITSFTYNAKSELDFLNDSKQKPLIFKGGKRALLQRLLGYHNQMTESYKSFQIGDITDFISGNDYIECEIDATKTTLAIITELIIDKFSLEMQVRRENGTRYLDIKKKIGTDSNTAIKLTVNMVRNSQKLNPDEIKTRLVPLGKRNENTGERLTIASVNGGRDYIDRPDLIDEFGIKCDNLTLDDETDPIALKKAAEDVMKNQKTVNYQYTLDAINLNLIKVNFDELVEGNTYPVINPVMGIDERLRIVSRQIDISKVEKSTLTIGDKFKSAEEYQAELIRQRTQNLVSKQRLEATEEALKKIQEEMAKQNPDTKPTEPEKTEGES